ncbi:ATP-binding protein [Novosphingobium sp.]|uniref:ATP-binding protein n=1 Tax=Novosphingobium sp. TaxID=1874826 RepID=UPI0025DEE78D|nr:ATP-binding protein [Novosphingobium sp.]MCC6926218.1 ATP-binding protein [Novosphingobium sp.]
MIRICFHGAESTGKSVMADKLSRELGATWVPEYGRTYCEERGTDLAMADLLAIAEGQDMAVRAALAGQPRLLLLDTDQLMTAAWAEMLFGEVPAALMGYPKADLYLLFSADVPWVDDGTRFFGKSPLRARFAALAEDMLVRAGVPWRRITGSWCEREQQVRAVIAELTHNAGA